MKVPQPPSNAEESSIEYPTALEIQSGESSHLSPLLSFHANFSPLLNAASIVVRAFDEGGLFNGVVIVVAFWSTIFQGHW